MCAFAASAADSRPRIIIESDDGGDPDDEQSLTRFMGKLDRHVDILTSFVAPAVSEPQTVHVLLQAEDNGTPPLVAYRRAVITVRP